MITVCLLFWSLHWASTFYLFVGNWKMVCLFVSIETHFTSWHIPCHWLLLSWLSVVWFVFPVFWEKLSKSQLQKTNDFFGLNPFQLNTFPIFDLFLCVGFLFSKKLVSLELLNCVITRTDIHFDRQRSLWTVWFALGFEHSKLFTFLHLQCLRSLNLSFCFHFLFVFTFYFFSEISFCFFLSRLFCSCK